MVFVSSLAFSIPFLLLHSMFISTFINCFHFVQPSQCHDDESHALLQFKEGFVISNLASENPYSYPKTSSWNASTNCCSWDGIECDESTGHVIGIDVSSSQLYGSVDANSSLFNLVHLQSLNLTDNHFNYSQIPSKIGELSKLRYLNLRHTIFSGEIPPQVSQLSKLLYLDLSSNVHSSPEGDEINLLQLKPSNLKSIIKNSTKLEVLQLGYVTISSFVPDMLANLTSLQKLSLYHCEMYGEFPVGIFHLPNLRYLYLRDNQHLTGRLPDFQSNALSVLGLHNTGFYGAIPASIGKLSSLNILSISGCNFFGSLPSSLGNLTQLTYIDLSYNNFTVDTFSWIGKLSSINYLDVSSLNIGSKIPFSFANLTHLQYLTAANNSLTGEISPSICNLKSLMFLDLSFNSLSDNVPSCLGNFSQSLKSLKLKGNKFSGLIPQTYLIGNALQMIDFSNNNLQGQLPRELVNCGRLEFFDVSHNSINDSFPFWLGDLPQLKVLALRGNQFHGAIRCLRNMTCTFPKLHIIDLSHNEFSGSLPLEMILSWEAMKASNTSQLQYEEEEITIYYRQIGVHSVKTINYVFAMSNKGVERVYPSLQKLYYMIAIDISSNKISGEIPKVIGDLRCLVFLNLSNNLLIGNIPSYLGKLSELEALDLSLNSLSGKIPEQLTQLTFLEFFNVSFNNLSGPIPQNKQFSTFECNSFEGNKGLFGDQLLKKCGGPSLDPPSATDDVDEDSEDSLIELDWKIALIGYAGGLVAGVALGHTFSPEIFRWLKRFF